MLWCPFLGVTLIVFPAFLQDFIAKCNFLKIKLKKGTHICNVNRIKNLKMRKTHQNDKYSLNKGLLKFDNKVYNAMYNSYIRVLKKEGVGRGVQIY